MKFGKVDNPENIDFNIPADDEGTVTLISEKGNKNQLPEIRVGCAKWNKTELKNFYPRGTKDELIYYSSQFNSIELNATFYRIFPPEQFVTWRNKTPGEFKFFPKVPQEISHFKRLNNVKNQTDEFIRGIVGLEEKLGVVFLQLQGSFTPKDFKRVEEFIENWPKEILLAIEFRHTAWFNDPSISKSLFEMLEKNNVINVIVDSSGRRDLLHMRLTTPSAFIRYVGANDSTDYARLDDWVQRIKTWIDLGIKQVYFFVHQNEEVESPKLAAYFIKKLNEEIGTSLKIPKTL